MKFGEIIQFIRSACRKLKELCLRFFSKPGKSETVPPPKPPQENQTQVLTKKPEPSSQKETDSSESSGTAKDEETQQDPSNEETKPSDPSPPDSTKNLEPQSESGQGKDSQKGSEPGRAPGKRGEDKPKQPDKTTIVRPQPPRCRFICYEDNRGLAVALAVEAGQDVQSVRQGNNELSAKDCRYILEDISTEVTVEFQGEHSSQSFQLLKEHKFVVFKMRKDWKGEGQKVKTLSSGDYVVFAHESCGKRINKDNKEPRNEPEQCRYPDFTVHFFSISKNNEKDGFKNCPLPYSSAKRFSLKGKSIPDDSDLGELFGDDAPQLDDDEKWREISWIVVGRENGGKVLAKKFLPELLPKEKEKILAEVLGERGGWFFVRIYDANVELLHSFPFRRAKGLKNIFVNDQPLGRVTPIVPTKNGHTKTIVQFEGDLPVRPADDSDGIFNGICKVTEKENTFAVCRERDNDWTKWVLGSGEDCVEAEILLPRIWWKFIDEKGEEGAWQDTPIKINREKFRGAKNEKIRIRFSFRVPEIAVGFDDLNSTDNPTIRTELSKDRKTCEAEFRLDDFADYQAIEKPLRKAVDLCVKLKDSDVVFSIVHIPADVKRRIRIGCNRKELKRAKEELYQEGWINAAKAAEKFEKLARGIEMTILFDNDKGHIVCTIRFDPQREGMLDKIVKKLKAFFKKHFEKE